MMEKEQETERELPTSVHSSNDHNSQDKARASQEAGTPTSPTWVSGTLMPAL